MSTKELAERLRAMGHERECDARTSAEAAAEIERLRAERDEARQAAAGCSAAYLASHRERDALRAENERLRGALERIYHVSTANKLEWVAEQCCAALEQRTEEQK